MSEPLTIVQRKHGTTFSFCFQDEKLVREHADNTGSNKIAVYYNNIDVKNSGTQFVDRLKKYRYIWAVWIFCVGLALVMAQSLWVRFALVVCGLIGVGFEIASQRRWISTRHTVFRIVNPETNFKFIFVLQDQNHDRIVSELRSRWRARLRRLYLLVDDTNNPASEISKFDWLLENDVISADEHALAVAQINASKIPSTTIEAPKVALN
jgi:hypothetical protein